MFRLLGFLIKFSILAVLILMIGNALSWNGSTFSDHVRTGMAHAEKHPSVQKASSWSKRTIEDLKDRLRGKFSQRKEISTSGRPAQIAQVELLPEEIIPSEQQKLRILIRDLKSEQQQAQNRY